VSRVLFCLIATFALSAALTPLVRELAVRLRRVAAPRTDRWHTRPVAMLGGYAIVLSAGTAIAFTGAFVSILPLLAGALAMFTLGAVDDEWHFRATTKLVAQTVIAAGIIYLAPDVRLTGLPVLDQLIALGWIVGITNAFNLLDNMDGLSAGIAVIAGLFYLAILVDAGSVPLALAMAAFTGATLGFLIYNFQPAKIFMGDAGSLFIGSFLGAAALFAAPAASPQLAPVAAIPLLILLIPIFDTAFVTITRKLSGRSPLVGGRDHLSHRLVGLGMPERLAVLGLYALAALGGLIGLSLLRVDFGFATTVLAGYLILLAGIGIVLGHVEAHAEATSEARAPLVAEVAYRNRIYEVLLDVALLTLAYYAAFRVRFQGPELAHFMQYFVTAFPVVLACQLAGLALAGKYRQVWRTFGGAELVILLRGILFGVAASVLAILYLYRFEGFSRTMFALDAAFLAFLLIGSRVAITSVDEYLRKQRRAGERVLIYGAGRGGALLLRELLENPRHGLSPLGFLDDDPVKQRLRIEGVPVLGRLEDLPAVIASHAPVEVLVSVHGLDRARLGYLSSLCRTHGLRVRVMRFALEELGPVPHVRHDSQAS
jgi:UDP-GlcNAc:undecaprenyl-phosphate GlcNAc-1-phosphate transferase